MINGALYQCQYFEYDKNSTSITTKCQFFKYHATKLQAIYRICTQRNCKDNLISPKSHFIKFVDLIKEFIKTHILYRENELCYNMDEFNIHETLNKLFLRNQINICFNHKILKKILTKMNNAKNDELYGRVSWHLIALLIIFLFFAKYVF